MSAQPPINPPDDPIRSHPTRAEQLDILADLVADGAPRGAAVLDLGIGTGYVAGLIVARRPDLRIAGIDLKAESLAEAREALDGRCAGLDLREANLERIEELDLQAGGFAFVLSVLTFHDLPDEAKRRVIGWTAARLAPGGTFLLMDRIRLVSRALFPLQVSIWKRIERVYGSGMRAASDFAAYEADLASNNRPARLADYAAWFPKAGLEFGCLHLHGNVGLFAGAKGAAR